MTGPVDTSEIPPGSPARDAPGYWRKNMRITTALLAVWFVVTFVVTYFARDLNFPFFGWPFSFWVAAQGALLVYLLLIGIYARYMNRLDDDWEGEGAADGERRG